MAAIFPGGGDLIHYIFHINYIQITKDTWASDFSQ